MLLNELGTLDLNEEDDRISGIVITDILRHLSGGKDFSFRAAVFGDSDPTAARSSIVKWFDWFDAGGGR
jgi:hypothetical protein